MLICSLAIWEPPRGGSIRLQEEICGEQEERESLVFGGDDNLPSSGGFTVSRFVITQPLDLHTQMMARGESYVQVPHMHWSNFLIYVICKILQQYLPSLSKIHYALPIWFY